MNIDADVLRVEATAAAISTTIRNNQFGFDTTNERIAYKDSLGAMHYFEKYATADMTDIVITDNISDAFQLRESTNDYINIDTSNSSEIMYFCNANNNPNISMLGTGYMRIAGELQPYGGIHDISGDSGCNITSSSFNITIGSESGSDVVSSGDGTGDYEFAVDGDLDIKNGTLSCSDLTASLPVFSDANKNLVSNAMTGTGNVVMSASPTMTTPTMSSPTITGTITAAAANFSGAVSVSGVLTTSDHVLIADDKQIRLGATAGGDATIEWDEDGDDTLLFESNTSTANSCFTFNDAFQSGVGILEVQNNGTEIMEVNSTGIDVWGDITFYDSASTRVITAGNTNGMQVVDSPTKLLGLWGATPIVQPTTATYGVWTTLANVVSALQAAGVLGA